MCGAYKTQSLKFPQLPYKTELSCIFSFLLFLPSFSDLFPLLMHSTLSLEAQMRILLSSARLWTPLAA